MQNKYLGDESWKLYKNKVFDIIFYFQEIQNLIHDKAFLYMSLL